MSKMVMQLAVVCLLGASFGWWFSPRGEAPPTPAPWVEPYGGCDEAYLYPGSRGARECAEHGR